MQLILPFLLLKAFAYGSVALTGTEAISDGVAAFKKPEAKNAADTMSIMAVLLGVIFFGISLLAFAFGKIPQEIGGETLLSQIARASLGGGIPYAIFQIATTGILLLAANTGFNGGPQLARILARDGFLPRQIGQRSDRLAYGGGIVAIAAGAVIFLIATGALVSLLIPAYAIGVFLGFTISRDRSRLALTISQPGYARHVVKMAGLENASIAPSPGEHLRPYTGSSRGAGDPARMRSLVGLMQYLTNSRPDIICELNKAAKTMSAPTKEDITAAERIIRYINGTLDHGITFSGNGPCQIVGYSDASNQSETGGYSRTSIILSLGEGNGAFVAKSYTQTLLGTSTQHSEIQAE
jgi:hypothetical protein